jgi:hypothetical protein
MINKRTHQLTSPMMQRTIPVMKKIGKNKFSVIFIFFLLDLHVGIEPTNIGFADHAVPQLCHGG